jgi:hypothetical protein
MCTAFAARERHATDQGETFNEDLRVTLGEYVASLPAHEQDFARSLEGND